MGFFSNLFGRTTRVAKGQINRGVDALEDATFESTLKQTVRDMKGELNKLVRASADAMSNHNRLEAEYQKHVRQADEWKTRAVKALEAGNEELAKKALAKKAESDQLVASMQSSVESARAASEKLRTQVGKIKQKIQEAERNASTLIARKNAARAQKKVAQALANAGTGDNAFQAINDFEESVAREEASAEAFETMAETGSDKQLDEEFAKLEAGNVDSELEALKKEIGK